MALSKSTIDKALTVLAGLASGLLPALADAHVITTLVAADIGAGITAALASYHGGAYVAARPATADPAIVP